MPEIKTVDELKAAYPDFTKAIADAAAEAARDAAVSYTHLQEAKRANKRKGWLSWDDRGTRAGTRQKIFSLQEMGK